MTVPFSGLSSLASHWEADGPYADGARQPGQPS